MRAMTLSRRFATIALVCSALAAGCGSRVTNDPNDREVPWNYGPLTGGATAEHLAGAGKKGGDPVAKGWHCRLQERKRLVVRPYQLAESHPLFDKVALSIGLFDKTGAQLGMLRSGRIGAGKATFTFDVDAATAERLWDLVIWYVKE